MLIQFQNMRGRPTLGGTSDQPSALRGGAISPRNSYSSSREPDAAFRERIAFRVFGSILLFMFVLPLILAGIAVKFG